MAKKIHEVVITVNGKAAEGVIKNLQGQVKQLSSELREMKNLGKENTKEYAEKEKIFKALSSAVKMSMTDLQNVEKVVKNLGSSSLRQLKQAVSSLNKEMASTSSGNVKHIEKLRGYYAKLQEQIRKTSLESVNAKKVAKKGNIEKASSSDLEKAIAQSQRELEYIKQGSKAYERQIQLIKTLNAEKNRRTEAFVSGVRNNASATVGEIQSARQKAQSLIPTTGDPAKIKEYQAVITELDNRLKGLTQTAVLTKNQLTVMTKMPGNYTPEKLTQAIAQLQNQLNTTRLRSPERQGIIDQITKLQNAIRGVKKEAPIARDELDKMAQGFKEYTPEQLQKAVLQMKEMVKTLPVGSEEAVKLNNNIKLIEQGMRGVDNAAKITDKDINEMLSGKGSFSIDQIKAAIATLKEQMNDVKIDVGGESSDKLQMLQQDIGFLETKLKNIQSQSVITEKQMKAMLENPAKFSAEKLRTAIRQVEQQLNSMTKGGPERKKLENDLRILNTSLTKISNEAITVGEEFMRNLKGKSLNELNAAAKNLSENLANMDRRTKEYIYSNENLKRIRAEIENINNGYTKQGKTLTALIQSTAQYLSVYNMLSKIRQKINEVVKGNLELSDSLTDIRKVSGLAMSDVNTLEKQIGKIDTRTAIQELNKLAYAGAKLGLGKYGIEGLNTFVTSANKINAALHEDLGDEAMTQLTKIGEVMGLFQSNDIGKPLEALGSAIFTLASSSTATGKNIVDFSSRLTGMARVSHITTDEILGLASAADAMYLSPEVASTSFSKFIAAIQTNFNLIEKKLDLPEDRLKNLLEAGKTMEAMVVTLEAMKKKGGINQLADVFKDLGSERGARMKNVMTAMSQNIDMLRHHLEMASDSFREASAVEKEYALQNETAAAYMQRASNIWVKSFVNPESVDIVKEFAQGWYDVSKSMNESRSFVKSLNLLLTALGLILKGIAYTIPYVMPFLMLKGAGLVVVPLLYKLRNGWVSLAAAFSMAARSASIAGTSIGFLGRSITALSKVIGKGNLILLGATIAYEGFSFLMDKLSKKTDEATESIKDFVSTRSQLSSSAQQEEMNLERLVGALKKAKEGTHERQTLLNQFNNKYGQYLHNLGLETEAVLTQAKAYDKLKLAMRGKVIAEMREREVSGTLGSKIGWSADRLVDYDNAYKSSLPKGQEGMFGASWLKAFVKDRKGKSVENIMSDFDAVMLTGGSNIDNPIRAGIRIAAERYVRQVLSLNNAEKSIDKKYSFFDEELKAWDDANMSKVGEFNPAEDKEAAKEARKAKAEAERARVQGLRIAKEESTAIISKLEEYYNMQEEFVNSLLATNRITKEESDSFLQFLKLQRLKSLSKARRAIATGDTSEWDTFKMTDMGESRDLFNKDAVSILADIRGVNVSGTHSQLQKLGGDAILDAVSKEGSKNARELSETLAKFSEEIRNLTEEFDNTNKVNREMADRIAKTGLLVPNADKMMRIKQQADSPMIASIAAAVSAGMLPQSALMSAVQSIGTTDKYKHFSPIYDVQKTIRDNVSDIFTMDMNSSTDRKRFLDVLFKDKTYASLFSTDKMDVNDIQALFQWAMDYFREYIEAGKRNVDSSRNISKFWWEEYTDMYRHYQSEEKGLSMQKDYRGMLQGNGYTMLQSQGFNDTMSIDPEVAMYSSRLMSAKAYYDFLTKINASQAELTDQQQVITNSANELAAAMIRNINARLENLKAWTQPIADSGWALGEAFATMQEDAEAGRQALVDVAHNIVETWTKMVIDMISQNQYMLLQQGVHIQAMQSMQDAANANKIAGQQSVNAAEQSMQAAHNATLIAGDAQYVMSDFALSQANAIAKCYSQLGPIGGSVAVAAITAILSAVLSYALKKAFPGGGKDGGGSANRKLVTGMLTYDEGNVQQYAGTDGHVYSATPVSQLRTGIVTSPIATSVNGRKSLVGEKGPEIVVGRETTKAMMMNDPGLVRSIVEYDKHYSGKFRTYDEGNVSDINIGGSNPGSSQLVAAIENLNAILAGGIKASINKYGAGGLVEEVADGLDFTRRQRSSKTVNRLFG